MKTFRVLALLLLLSLTAQAASFRVECDFYITTNNGPVSGATFTLNSQSRMWTNNTLASTNWIITTNGYGNAATNLYQALISSPMTNVAQVDVLGTNAIRIYGTVDYLLTISPSAGWSTNILRTNTLYNSAPVWSPYPTNFTLGFRTNQMLHLASNLAQFSTYSIPTNAALLSNHLSLGIGPSGTTQQVTGPKILNDFQGTNTGTIYGGTYQGPTITNALLKGGSATNMVLTNCTLAGTFFELSGQSPGGTLVSDQTDIYDDASSFIFDRSSALATPTLVRTNVEDGMWIGYLRFDGYGDTGFKKAVRLVALADERFDNTTSAGRFEIRLTPTGSVGDVPRVSFTHKQSSFTNAVWVTGAQTNAGGLTATNVFLFNGTWTNGAAALSGATITNLNVPTGGTLSNVFLATPKLTNATLRLLTTFAGGIVHPRLQISSLADGANAALPILTNSKVLLLPGALTATASIDGIDSTGIADGFQLDILSFTGQTITFGAESGLEATAANRIIVLNTTTNFTTDGRALFEYSSLSNRWVLLNLTP